MNPGVTDGFVVVKDSPRVRLPHSSHEIRIKIPRHRFAGGVRSSLHAEEARLVADAPIKVPDSAGGFDFLKIDATRNRLLANHTGNNSLDDFDLADGRSPKGVTSLGDVDSLHGAKTITYDTKARALWIAYEDAGSSYIQRYREK